MIEIYYKIKDIPIEERPRERLKMVGASNLTDKELRELIAEKYMIIKSRKIISLKPVEDKFKQRIEKYMEQVKEVRLK